MDDLNPGPATYPPPPDTARYRRLLHDRQVEVHHQPIIDLRSGAVLGLELLGRLRDGDQLAYPKSFLPYFDAADRQFLFDQSLEHGLIALPGFRAVWPQIRLSLNIEPSLLLDPAFVPTFLSRAGTDAQAITLEMLESGDILNLELARRQIDRLRSSGVRIALDDIGSAYSSLIRLKDLPIDAIKLDQYFVRELEDSPQDIAFVSSIMALGRGLGCRLVVEGVETPAILDAMRILGVEAAQGYAIARPMNIASLSSWLHAYVPEPRSNQPQTLLGAYASHLNLVDAYRALFNQPVATIRLKNARDPHACMIGQFLDRSGLHDAQVGLAHKHFHTVLPYYGKRQAAWEEAASRLKLALEAAIRELAGPRPSSRQGRALPEPAKGQSPF